MKITEERVRYVAALANLNLTQPEVERMAREMDSILEHIDKLSELDTAGVEPMAQVLYDAEDSASLRADVERTPFSNDEALSNAPLASGGYFKVPKVIER